MNKNCISFEKMSDFCDNQIATEEEKQTISDHIEICPTCGLEYEKLKKTFNFLNDYKKYSFDLTKITDSTMIKIQKKERKKKILKFVPMAMAASLLLVFGVSFLFNSSNAKSPINTEFANNNISDSSKVIQIIKKNNASLLRITDNFIEGEIDRTDYNKLRRELGFRKVAYSLAQKQIPSSIEKRFNNQNIKQASFGGIDSYTRNNIYQDSEKIRFRVYK